MISRIAAMVVAAASLVSARAAAEGMPPPMVPLAAALRVEPNPCFDAASLAPAMAWWLQRDTLDRRIEVEVAGQAGSAEGLVIRVRRDGERIGERRFTGLLVSCAEVRAAVGLAAALAVEATVLESLGVRPAPAAPPPPVAPTPPAIHRTGLAGSIDAAVLFGVLPSPVPAFVPTFGVRPVPAVELRFSGIFTARGALALDRWSVGVGLAAAHADACAVFPVGFVRARACAGLAGRAALGDDDRPDRRPLALGALGGGDRARRRAHLAAPLVRLRARRGGHLPVHPAALHRSDGGRSRGRRERALRRGRGGHARPEITFR